MKRNLALFALLTLFPQLDADIAFAADGCHTASTLITFATNLESEANMIQIPGNIHSNCHIAGNSRAYIRRENKHIFAAALTASSQNKEVTVCIKYDSDALTIQNALPSPLTCEVLQIIFAPSS